MEKDLEPGRQVLKTLSLPKDTVGHIIGKQGRNIKRIMTEYGVIANVTRNNFSGTQNLYLWGPTSSVEEALEDARNFRDNLMKRSGGLAWKEKPEKQKEERH